MALDVAEPISLLSQLTKTSIGMHAPDGSVRVGRTERQGYVLHGPVCGLDAGNYGLRFRCKVGTPECPTYPVIGAEIVAPGGQLVWRDFTADELADGSGIIRFVTPELNGEQAQSTRFNFKLFHFANADLAIVAVELMSVAPEEGHRADTTSYRLLALMRTKEFVRRQADGRVTVSRWSRRGGFLSESRLVALPAGHYRLSIGGRVRRARLPTQPVLGVEITTRSGQVAYRDFTLHELERGRAVLDFQLILARNEDETKFEIELQHFGNADLEINSVDLALVEAPANEVAAKCWRLVGRLRDPMRAFGVAYSGCSRVVSGLPFLFGIRPRLRLAVGFYRLVLDLRGEVPPDLPVTLGDLRLAAISDWRPPRWLGWVAHRLRWRLRSAVGHIATYPITVDQLREGRVEHDFEIPADLTYDGKHTWVDLKFFRRTKTRLEIENISIESLNESKARITRSTAAPSNSRKSQRAKLVVFGNCQAEIVARVLRTELRDIFTTSYHSTQIDRSADQHREEIERADVLLVQDISDLDSSPMELGRAAIRVVRFPTLRFASLWPFDEANGLRDPEARQSDWQQAFQYLDGLLGRLRKETPDHELRFARYASLQVDLVAPPMRLHEFEIRRLAAMDRNFQTGIGQLVIENFRERRLFYTTSHPTGEMFALLLDHLTGALELKSVALHARQRWDSWYETCQVPVHPMVAKMLGVKWANERTTYRYGSERITWETYVRRYIKHYG
jgi:hypothetical protein